MSYKRPLVSTKTIQFRKKTSGNCKGVYRFKRIQTVLKTNTVVNCMRPYA